MSIRNALIKLCTCATGGALFGGGAVHIGDVTPKKPQRLWASTQAARPAAPRLRTASVDRRAQRVVKRIRRHHTKTVTTVTHAPQAIQIAGFMPPAAPVSTSGSPPVSSEGSTQSRGGGYFGGGYFGGWAGGGAGGGVVLVSANATATANATSSSSSNVTLPPPHGGGGGHDNPPPGDHGGHRPPPGGGGGDGPPPGPIDVPAPPAVWLFGLAILGLFWGQKRHQHNGVWPS